MSIDSIKSLKFFLLQDRIQSRIGIDFSCHSSLISLIWTISLAFLCPLWHWHFWSAQSNFLNRVLLIWDLLNVFSCLDSPHTVSTQILHKWCCILLRVSHLETQCYPSAPFWSGHLKSPGQRVIWFLYCAVTFSLAINEQSMGSHFESMKIACFPSLSPIFSMHW